MGKSNVVGLNRPEESSTDALSEIIRVGAQKIL